MKIKSMNYLKKLFNSEKVIYVYKNPYFLNQEIKFFKGKNTTVIDGMNLFQFNFNINDFPYKGEKVIFNSMGDILPFKNYYKREIFNDFIEILYEHYEHILFFIPQKEKKYFNVNEYYFISLDEEEKILSSIKEHYSSIIFPFLSKISNGQISVFSILHILSHFPGLKLSEIAKKAGKKSPVIKVYLNRMIDANVIISSEKRYYIPSNYFIKYLSKKGKIVTFNIEEPKEEKEYEKKSDFDYLN